MTLSRHNLHRCKWVFFGFFSEPSLDLAAPNRAEAQLDRFDSLACFNGG